jgi:hypothetical protein
MKRLRRIKRIVKSMQRLIERELTVDLIGEDLFCADQHEDACNVAAQLEVLRFDQCGVRDRSGVIGFVERTDLKAGVVGDYFKPIPPEHMVDHADPLWDALPKIVKQDWLFIESSGGVEGIVTVADLSKQPARLLMFGCVSTLEMTMLALIRRYYDGNGWSTCLTDNRLKKAEEEQEKRRKNNQDIDLVDCLQLCDEGTVCLETIEIRECWDLSKSKGKLFFTNLETIRNQLAHGQDLALDGNWTKVKDNLVQAYRLVQQSGDLLYAGGEGMEVTRSMLETSR